MATVTEQEPCVVLAINCGSSSLKFGLYNVAGSKGELLAEGEAEQLGSPHSTFWFRQGSAGQKQGAASLLQDTRVAFHKAVDALERSGAPKPSAIGHRIVHGGARVRDHAVLTGELLRDLEEAAKFAPLHVPPALEVVTTARDRLGGLRQVICLDTAFHRHMSDVARTLPLPRNVRDLGIERYGFHGLSMESIVMQLRPVPERLVVAHLGGGCSVSAIHKGRSIDNTMGLTPTGGILMGTRPGDLDPGVMIYLQRNGYGSPEKLEDLVDRHSGLLGISETSTDMRELTNARNNDERADLALRMFVYQVRKAIAAMAAALGGVDALVFTGGIGEHASDIREQICAGLKFLGNFDVRVLPSQEDLAIALITARLTAA